MVDLLFSHLGGIYGALHLAMILGATSTKKTSSSSSIYIFLIIILIGGYLLLGPQRKRKRQAMDLQRQIGEGDEVVTTSGIIGRVERLGDDRVSLAIAPGTTVEVLRGAVARRLGPVVPPSSEVAEAEAGSHAPDDDEPDEGGHPDGTGPGTGS